MLARSTPPDPIVLEERHFAHVYRPLPLTMVRGEAEWLWDTSGNRYLDLAGAGGALALGHRHPRILHALASQLDCLTLTSRDFHNAELGPWSAELAESTGHEAILPLSSGIEAIETSLRLAQKWGWERRGVTPSKAHVVVVGSGASTPGDPTPTFGIAAPLRASLHARCDLVAIDDIEAVVAALRPETIALLVEPIQAEGFFVVPRPGFLSEISRICAQENILFILDEVQTGLARTGRMFAFEHDAAPPDILILGGALGGGVVPISALCASWDILSLLRPGDHCSTYGGNPLACAVSREVLRLIQEERLDERAHRLGRLFRNSLATLPGRTVREVRGRGLLNAIELQCDVAPARIFVEKLANRGILATEISPWGMRFTPPLVIAEESLLWAAEVICETLVHHRYPTFTFV